jgi:hypothetical protein
MIPITGATDIIGRTPIQHPERLRQQHHLNEQRFDLFEKALTKVGKRVVVRMPISRYESERQWLKSRTLDLTAAEDARAVPIHEQGKEDLGRVGLTSTRAEARIEMAKIKLGDQINAV